MYLLQIDPSDYFSYFIGFVVAFLIGVFISRWIFRIDTIVHYSKVQADILIKIAKYNNVPHDEIYQALGMKPPKKEDNDFDNNIAAIIQDSGVSAAIGYVMNLKGTSPGSARTYVDELIEKRNITPKK